MSQKEELMKMIDDLVSKQTFSLEGLKAIQKLKDEFNNLQDKYDRLLTVKEDLNKEVVQVTDRLTKISKEYDQLQKRETDVLTREAKLNLIDLELKLTKESKAEFRWMFEMIFKNTIVRENISGNVAATPGPTGMYPTTIPVFENKEITSGT